MATLAQQQWIRALLHEPTLTDEQIAQIVSMAEANDIGIWHAASLVVEHIKYPTNTKGN